MLATSVVSGRSEPDDARGSARGTTSRPTTTSADQERRQPADRGAERPAAESRLPDGDRGEDRHEQDGDQVLDDQDADDELAQPAR